MRAFDYSHSKAALILLTGYQTPDGLRRVGVARLEAWLRNRKAYNASAVAATAIEAANAQHTVVPGQQIVAAMVARLDKEVMGLDTEIGDTETTIEDRFRRHRHAEVILSMPGFGIQLGAEFLAATGHTGRIRRDPRKLGDRVETHELAFAGAAQQARMLADGIITAPELLGVYLERIGRLDPELRSYRVVLADSAREAAAAAQTRLDAGERLPLLAVTWQPSTAWTASPAYPAWRRKDTHA